MQTRKTLVLCLVGGCYLSTCEPTATADKKDGWRKHTINDRSPFEAAAAADFNGDGRMDVVSRLTADSSDTNATMINAPDISRQLTWTRDD